MKVAIHQPNYLPWIGYFYKMHLSDTFVILDDVQFSKGSYTNRVRIKSLQNEDELDWLTVPLKKASLNTLIKDVIIDKKEDWFDKHSKSLKSRYGNEPNFSRLIGLLEYAVKEADSEKLTDINCAIISHISNYLYVNPTVVYSSKIDKDESAEDVTLSILKSLKGSHYISGLGGQNYQTEEQFTEHKITRSFANIQGFLNSSKGILANPLGAKTGASIFDWLVRYSNTEIKELFRTAESQEVD